MRATIITFTLIQPLFLPFFFSRRRKKHTDTLCGYLPLITNKRWTRIYVEETH